MTWFFTNLLAAFLLPPLNLLLLAALGLFLWHKHPRIARGLLAFSTAGLWLLSTPYIAEGLLHQLEEEYRVPASQKLEADAIVVLGGGSYFQAPEYGGDTVSREALERLRYAAKLHRQTSKPILVTGGAPLGNAGSEAEQMKQVLEQEFNIPVKWAEGGSNDTWQNALNSYKLLHQQGIERIYLVTHAWHMPRSTHSFHHAGFQIIPAPTGYTTRHQLDLLAFLPNAMALRDSHLYFHELIGMLWYRLKS